MQKRLRRLTTAFYDALSGRDIAAMRCVWADRPYIVNIGPRSRMMDVGYDAVMPYWERSFNFFSRMSSVSSNTRIRVNGDVAWAIGNETADLQPRSGGDVLRFETFVTHVFERIDGKWMLVSHHAQMVPR